MTDTGIAGVLKTVYSNVREKIVPIATPLFANIKKGAKGGSRNFRWGGNGVVFDAVMSRPVGMTASSTGNLPPSSAAVEKQGTFNIKRLYVTREVDGLAIAGTGSTEASFVNLAKKLVEEAKDAIQLGMQEFSHSDGRGVKAILSSTADTTHCVVTSPYGISGAGQGGLLLDVGMYVAVLDTTGTTQRGAAEITAVSNSGDNATLTFGSAIAGMGATDIVVAATSADNSFNSFPNGLTNIMNRGGSYNALHILDASTSPRWDTLRLVAGTDTPDAALPTEFDIWELATRVAGRSGKDAKLNPGEFMLLTTPGLERKFAESFFGQRSIGIDKMMDIKGGFKAVSFSGIPMISDPWCPAGVVYLVHLPSLSWIDAVDWGAVAYEDSSVWRPIANKDAYQTSFRAYLQLGTTFRSAHGLISGYADSNRYSLVM